MAIRTTHQIDDIQTCIYTMLNSLTTSSPWSSWQVIRGYPETDVFERFTKPFIWVEAPYQTSITYQQGGLGTRNWELVIGVWADRSTGGNQEVAIMAGRLMYLLQDPQTVNRNTTFNLTLGGTSYTATYLSAQGVFVTGATGPRDINIITDIKEFRQEILVQIEA